jgi:hypothetical protein
MSKQGKHHNRNRRATVYVDDHTTALWNGMVEAMVAQFTAILGEWGPRLIYRRYAVRDCGAIPAPRVASRVSVCSALNDPAPFSGTCGIGERYDAITLYDAAHTQATHQRNTICHELMHALGDLPDAYDTNPDSCIYGHLDHPGGHDIALLQQHIRRKARR